MNLSQLSNNYQFLYSPKSWLHVKNKNYKIIYVFLQLIILPYIRLQYIVIIFTTTLIFFKFVNLPTKIHRNLCITIIFFLFTLVNNIYYTTKYAQHVNINNDIINIQPLHFIDRFLYIKHSAIQKLTQSQFYLSTSISRLIMISLTYLFTIKIFLLTTNYEEIIASLLGQRNIITTILNSEIPFTVILSSQFLKIIFTCIYTLKVAYLIRGIHLNKYNFLKKLLVYFFLIKGFFITFYTNIKFITKTLYSRDILKRHLHIINIYDIQK